jgi:hypothetical protein
MRPQRAIRKRALIICLLASVTVTSSVWAQVPGGCNTPVSHRTRGRYLTATEVLGALPQGPLFWHLYQYSTRAAAETAKGQRGTVVESFEKARLYCDRRVDRRQVASIATIGPLPISPGKQYTAHTEAAFLQACERPYIGTRPEAWYLVSGTHVWRRPKV